MADGDQPNRNRWLRDALDRYGGPLTRYAAQIVGDADLARDVVQDTFLKLWSQDASGLDGRLPEWLFTVCRNRALDVRRKDRRMNATDQLDQRLSTSPPPSVAAEGREQAGRLVELLTGLPERTREILRLKFEHGMTYRQIATITGLSVTNVGFIIHTGIKTLREHMNA